MSPSSQHRRHGPVADRPSLARPGRRRRAHGFLGCRSPAPHGGRTTRRRVAGVARRARAPPRRPRRPSATAPAASLGVADGRVPDGVTVFDDSYPAVANLDPELLDALREPQRRLRATGSSSTSTAAGAPRPTRSSSSTRRSRRTAREQKPPAGWPRRRRRLTCRGTPSTSGRPTPRPGCPPTAPPTGCARSTATNPGTTSCAPTPPIRLSGPVRRPDPRSEDATVTGTRGTEPSAQQVSLADSSADGGGLGLQSGSSLGRTTASTSAPLRMTVTSIRCPIASANRRFCND